MQPVHIKTYNVTTLTRYKFLKSTTSTFAVAYRCSVFLKTSQNSQENTCVASLSFNKVAGRRMFLQVQTNMNP